MKIHDVKNDGQNIQYINQGMKSFQSEKNPVALNISGPASASDRVELSPQSKNLKKIQEILATTPEMRTEKMAELKKAIAEGTYKVNAGNIAEKMIQEMILELNH